MQPTSASSSPAMPAEISPLARYHREIAWMLGLGLLVLLAFWPVLEADFLAWDDDINIYENPHIQGLNNANLKWMFTDFEHALRYKPLSWLSWAIIYQFSELHPFGYHFANLLFHLINTGLVFLLLRRLCLVALNAPPEDSRAIIAAGIGAAFWAVHPLRVESVAWATALPYGQALCFLLMSLMSYLRYAGGGGSRWYWTSVVLFAFALLTYPTVLGAVGVFIALDFWPLKRVTIPQAVKVKDAKVRRLWLEKIPFLLLTIICLGGTLLGRVHDTGDWPEAKSLEEFGLSARMMQAFYVWAYFLWKPLVPLDLSPVYTTFIYFKPTDFAFVLSLVAVVGVTAGVFSLAKRFPFLAMAWFCHLAILVPVLGLTERPHYHHDRYSLISGIVWAGVVTAVVCVLAVGRWRRFAFGLTGALILALAGFSHRQTAIWDNDLVFMEDMVSKLSDSPYRSTAFLKLGNVYLESQDPIRAEAAFRESIRLNPAFAKPYFNLANLLASKGTFGEATPLYQMAIQLEPKHVGARNNLAIVLIQQGKLPEAEKLLREAAALAPENADTHFNLAEALKKQGRPAEADKHYQEAARLKTKGH